MLFLIVIGVIGWVILLVIAMNGVMAWGRTLNDNLVTAVVIDRQTNTRYYQIIDMNQAVRLTKPIAVDHISSTSLIGSGRCLAILAGANPQQQSLHLLDIPAQTLRRIAGEISIFTPPQTLTVDVDRSGFDCRAENIDAMTDQFATDPMLAELPAGISDMFYFLPSPDRQWAAFHVLTENSQDTFTFHRPSGTFYQLNTDDFFITSMDWSPDSARLAYTINRYTSLPRANAAVVDADGQNARPLGVLGSQPQWSPDGRYIIWKAWNETDRFNARGFFLVQPDAPDTIPRYLATAEDPVWSADGEHLAYIQRVVNPPQRDKVGLLVVQPETPQEGRLMTSPEYDVITFDYWR